jgi:diguanylate cyclase (GGDEF)-like protein
LVAAVNHHHEPEAATGRTALLAGVGRAADALADLEQAGMTIANVNRARAATLAIGLLREPVEWLDESARAITRCRPWAIDPALARSAQSPSHPRLQRRVAMDPAQALPDRKAFRSAVQAQTIRSRRFRQSFVVMVIEVDHLTQISRTHGHWMADRFLLALRRRIAAALGEHDRMSHLDGLRFGLILPAASASAGRARAERVRAAIQARPVDIGDHRIGTTVSGGAVHIGTSDARLDVDPILALAEQALSQAKWAGRNQVIWHETPATCLEPMRALG